MARARPGLQKAVLEILERHGSGGKRLSYRQCERLTGLSPAAVGELAKGNARTPATICRFARGLGEDVERLLLLAGFVPDNGTPAPRSPEAAPLTDAETELIEKLALTLRALPPGPLRAAWSDCLRANVDLLRHSLQQPEAEPRHE